MEDLSNWDFVEAFSAFQASALIVGADPTNAIDSVRGRPVLEKLRMCYHESWGYWHARFDGKPDGTANANAILPESAIQSVDMINFGDRFNSHQHIDFHKEPDRKKALAKVEASAIFSGWIGWGSSQNGEHSRFDRQEFSRKELDRWIAAIGMKSAYPFIKSNADSKQPVEVGLSTKERITLLKLVIGMAIKGYGYDPAASKSSVPKEIADDLSKIGDLDVSDDTVRKYLKLAVSEVLSQDTKGR